MGSPVGGYFRKSNSFGSWNREQKQNPDLCGQGRTLGRNKMNYWARLRSACAEGRYSQEATESAALFACVIQHLLCGQLQLLVRFF